MKKAVFIFLSLLFSVEGFSQQFSFGISYNTMGFNVNGNKSLGLLQYNDPKFDYFTNGTGEEMFHYVETRSNELRRTTNSHPIIPCVYVRYYAKNRWFFQLSALDDFETKQQIQMSTAKKGYEQKVIDSDISGLAQDSLSGYNFTFASTKFKTSTISPSLGIFVLSKKLFRVYLLGGAPVYLSKYSPEKQDILHPSYIDAWMNDPEYAPYLYDYTAIQKVIVNYRAGLGIHFYNFFLEGFYQSNITPINDTGFYKSFPRIQIMVGVNLLSKKFYKNEFKKNVLPRERESY